MKKKKLLVLGLPLLLLGGGAGAYMTGQLDSLIGTEQATATAVEQVPLPPAGTEFVELRDMGLSVIRDGIVFEVVYLDLSLEVTADARPLVERHRPRMLDRIQAALRELFSYRSRRGMPPIDVAEMKAVVLQVTRRMFGDAAIVDAHLISDWVTTPGT
ncbi:MAG: hypothetical protein ACFCVH_22710 [Alphaproteobacteria bacterium]